MNRFLEKRWPPFLLVALAALVVWGHTVTFGFVWDDIFFIRDLPSVRSLANLPQMFTSIEAQASDPYLFRVFRPVRTAQYALLHALDGHEVPQPWIFHLANVLWHAATAMMLFAVLVRLLPKMREGWEAGEARWWALFVALAFAVHPVTSEVVCWAKGLDDILAAFFTLACLRELLGPADSRAARWRALLWFSLAVYSKESAVPFAMVPLVIYRAVHQLPWREAAQRTFLFLFVGLVYMAHRGFIIERQSQSAPLSGSYGQTLVDMLPVVTKYFRLLWGIPPFFIDYKYLKGGYALGSMEVLVGLGLLLGLAGVAGWAWRRPGWRLAGVATGRVWLGLDGAVSAARLEPAADDAIHGGAISLLAAHRLAAGSGGPGRQRAAESPRAICRGWVDFNLGVVRLGAFVDLAGRGDTVHPQCPGQSAG
jgi:hypothetical protein